MSFQTKVPVIASQLGNITEQMIQELETEFECYITIHEGNVSVDTMIRQPYFLVKANDRVNVCLAIIQIQQKLLQTIWIKEVTKDIQHQELVHEFVQEQSYTDNDSNVPIDYMERARQQELLYQIYTDTVPEEEPQPEPEPQPHPQLEEEPTNVSFSGYNTGNGHENYSKGIEEYQEQMRNQLRWYNMYSEAFDC